jgi:hypothetical protein
MRPMHRKLFALLGACGVGVVVGAVWNAADWSESAFYLIVTLAVVAFVALVTPFVIGPHRTVAEQVPAEDQLR